MLVLSYWFSQTALPNPNIRSAVNLYKTYEQRDDYLSTFILNFDVTNAPPTYITCQVGNTSLDVTELSRQVIDAGYPPSLVEVNITLRTKKAGNYQCSIFVFRASGELLANVTTPPLAISGDHLNQNSTIMFITILASRVVYFYLKCPMIYLIMSLCIYTPSSR